jgi:hypothetical protein
MTKHSCTRTSFPKDIYTFWNTKSLPPTVKQCIKTWKTMNPGYRIHILTPKTLPNYLPSVNMSSFKHASDFIARYSDYVRALILSKFGGFWIDASTVCTESISSWLKRCNLRPSVEFVGFYISLLTRKKNIKKYPIIENWMFGCKKNSKFMKSWKNEFLRTNQFETIENYLDDVHKRKRVDFQHIDKYDDSSYLTMHVAAQKVLQYNKYPLRKLHLEEAESGPLKYRLYRKGKLSVKQRVERLAKHFSKWISYPFIKFTGEDRHVIEKQSRLRKKIFKQWFQKFGKGSNV